MAAIEGVILDTGPLVALFDEDDQHHAWARGAFAGIKRTLVTCDAVLSESFFLLKHLPRHHAALRQMFADGAFDLSLQLRAEARHVARLMTQYQNLPMSLADACLVRLSELHPKFPVLTLDSDFRVYRRNKRDMIPCLSPSLS
jgi:uncharacterized protein